MIFRADIEEDELVDIDDENEEEKISLDFEGFMKVVGTQNSAQDLELKEATVVRPGSVCISDVCCLCRYGRCLIQMVMGSSVKKNCSKRCFSVA